MEFNERLDKIWERISDGDFLANRGVANEVRYYVFDYEPCDELIIRDKIKALKKQNNPDADGFQIVEYDLYEMVIQILEEKGYVDKCIKFEDQKGMEYLYRPCETWQNGEQINLWTYWQGFQLDDIDDLGVDILLVGQDWGNPDRNKTVCAAIKEIQNENKSASYITTAGPSDMTLKEMFKAFGNIDITKRDPGMRLFFTNYSLGYRSDSETGGMTKRLMKQDSELFNDLVAAIRPKIIICLGKLTYEMVSGTVAKDFVKTLKEGNPFRTQFPLNNEITVYGVAHPGSRGVYNVGGKDIMFKAWEKIAADYKNM